MGSRYKYSEGENPPQGAMEDHMFEHPVKEILALLLTGVRAWTFHLNPLNYDFFIPQNRCIITNLKELWGY
jgi:hypothetical protein